MFVLWHRLLQPQVNCRLFPLLGIFRERERSQLHRLLALSCLGSKTLFGGLGELQDNTRALIHSKTTTPSRKKSSKQDEQSPWKRLKKEDPSLRSLLRKKQTRETIRQLSEVMGSDMDTAKELVKRDSTIVARSNSAMKKIKLLRQYGFTAHDIVSNPTVLHRTQGVIEMRLEGLQELGPLDSVSLSALRQPDRVFNARIEKWSEEHSLQEGFSSRNQFLMDLLDCDAETVEKLLEANKFLSSCSLVLLQKKVNILLDHQLSKQTIRENMRAFTILSLAELLKRLERIKDNRLSPHDPTLPLPHLLSCSKRDFELSLNHAILSMDALEGCKDMAEYLAHRLGCTVERAQVIMMAKDLQETSPVKLRALLDFFLNEMEVSPEFVLQHRSLMKFSVSRLRRRWLMLCLAGDNDLYLLPSKFRLSEMHFNREYGRFSVDKS